MTDVLAYRAVVPLKCALLSEYTENGTSYAVIRTPEPVVEIDSVKVGQYDAAAVTLTGLYEAVVELSSRQQGTSVAGLDVYAFVYVLPESGIRFSLNIGFGNTTTQADAVLDALQRTQRFLLRTPGSDPWAPSSGGLLVLRSMQQATDAEKLRVVDEACDRYNKTTSSMRRSRRGVYVSQVSAESVTTISSAEARNIPGFFSETTGRVTYVRLRAVLRTPNGTITAPLSLAA
jgi:hypothetical protein